MRTSPCKSFLLFCSSITCAVSVFGCSDPATTPPQGAFALTFGGSGCQATMPTPDVKIGVAEANQKATIADGDNGVSVACSVIASGQGYAVSARIAGPSNTSFRFVSDVIPKQQTSAKNFDISGPNTVSATYTIGDNGESGSCKVNYIDGAPGRIWASFSCDKVTATSLLNSCGVYNGFVVLENCSDK